MYGKELGYRDAPPAASRTAAATRRRRVIPPPPPPTQVDPDAPHAATARRRRGTPAPPTQAEPAASRVADAARGRANPAPPTQVELRPAASCSGGEEERGGQEGGVGNDGDGRNLSASCGRGTRSAKRIGRPRRLLGRTFHLRRRSG